MCQGLGLDMRWECDMRRYDAAPKTIEYKCQTLYDKYCTSRCTFIGRVYTTLYSTYLPICIPMLRHAVHHACMRHWRSPIFFFFFFSFFSFLLFYFLLFILCYPLST